MKASISQIAVCVEQVGVGALSHFPLDGPHEGMQLPRLGAGAPQVFPSELPHEFPHLPQVQLDLLQEVVVGPHGVDLPPLGSHFGAHVLRQVAESSTRLSNDSTADTAGRDHCD